MDITPEQLRKTRKGIGLTARVAAASIHVSERTWQGYEAPQDSKSFRAMPSGLLELFCLKHCLPYPPLRLDGTPTVGAANVISIVSATGGCGKTSITFEVARALAKAGQRTAIITDDLGSSHARFAFEHPVIFAEDRVSLTDYEVKDMRVKLRAGGVIDGHGNAMVEGIDLFIHQGELNRLAMKASPVTTLQELTKMSDFVFLDISANTETAMLVSDAVVYVLDLANPFAAGSAKEIYSNSFVHNAVSGASPKLFCLLTNKEPSRHQFALGNYQKAQSIGIRVLDTILSTSHSSERRELRRRSARRDLNCGRFDLLADVAPTSMASLEYRAFANELLRHLGVTFQF
jgi:cellulose biosynthesis protein BcsQ